MKVDLIIQARYDSSRLPGKVLMEIEGKEILLHMIERLSNSTMINNIIVATSVNPEDDQISDFCLKNKIKCFRGSEENVLERFYQVSMLMSSDIIIRCTGDCPLIDYNIIDDMLKEFLKNKYEYIGFNYPNNFYTFPDGFDINIFSIDALIKSINSDKSKINLENVVMFMRKEYLSRYNVIVDYKKYSNIDFSKLHLSLDTEEDFNVINRIFKKIYPKNKKFLLHDVLECINSNPEILIKEEKNISEGKGQKLYREAKKIIPGGTQLLSKRPEMFLPENWPSYYRRANGIEITTLDNTKLKDFSYMGVGSCILGYGDEDVNKAVIKSVIRGNMSTLNSPKEVEVTKLLCQIHPWAEMARYSKSGGESCTIAVRIARAFTGKDKVAFCGYHGWHDWYLSSNWNNGNDLDNHLLKGLNPLGVPKNLKDTAFPFSYNKIGELEEILKNHDIGTIIMEPQRNSPPENNFLQNIRKICNDKKIVLIFDEISSGFRLNSGGLHMLYNVYPDMAVFGKAISNGYSFGAVIGRRNVMSKAEETFISSTYWTEDTGFSASLATIKKHTELNVGNHISKMGNYFQKELKTISDETGIKLKISGMPCFSAFAFDYQNKREIKTLFIQIMLERNILAKNCLYLSYAHKKEDIDFYLQNIREVFTELKILIEKNKITENLKGPVAHDGFKRLT